ncbi:hypothetical protein [Jeotgalibacillus sp. R-1-5s-1]|uniref:hypothetical protein n=1 Tax=Jeotgalibacillus sp. R-1-5s-1 TaxID=2555897 RepID=UPI0010696640|nr:hypothetical protein [Jeotgalibacillus sp. R-1-5s-1]TFE02465.1 hypothetical protein E2491_02675 [Jeotgalibacillus sp. R-1-5s-1]
MSNRHSQQSSSDQPSSKSPSKDYSTPSKPFFRPSMLVVMVFVICILSLAAVYAYETWRNQQVEAWKTSAENAAYNKQWKDAERDLAQAASVRPEYESVHQSLSAVRDARLFENRIARLEEQLAAGQVEQVENEIRDIRETLQKSKNSLLFLEQEKIMSLKEASLVSSIKNEIKEPLSIQALAGKLLEVSEINHPEADEVQNLIRNQIAGLSIEQASVELDKFHFTEALNIVEIGLGYAPLHEELISYKKTIEAERNAYQEEEYIRLAEAQEEAERQDHFNRTEAVSVEEWEVKNINDTIQLTGTIKNIGTRPISWIEIEWTVTGKDGQVLSESLTVVDPEYVLPEGQGSFKDELNLSGDYEKVEITSITWYLE